MKRKLFTNMLALVLCTAFVPTYAADVRQSGEADVLIVSGDSFTPYENIPVIALAAGADKDGISALIASGGDISGEIIYTGTAVADAEGKVHYTMPLGSLTDDGEYQVYVGGVKYDVGFMKNANRINLVDLIVGAGDSLPAVLEQNYMYLSVDNEMYKLCSGSAAIAAVLKTELANTTLSSQTENAIAKLAEMIDKSALVVAANERKLTDLSQIQNNLSECTNTNKVLGLVAQTTDAGKLAIVNGFQGNGFTTVNNADLRLAKEIALNAICYPTVQTSAALINILENNNSVLGLDLSGFNSLSSANQGAAIVAFSNQKPTVATMQSVLDSIVNGYVKQTASTSSGGGGSSSSGEGSMSFIAPTIPSSGDDYASATSVFDDLTEVSWAKEAILTLHAKGIISGYGNKQFAPNNNIKREEFVKLVVGAYYSDEAAAAVTFSDVNANAWYYDSIGIAVGKGIISGIDEMNFGTGMNITRQDMAVILYRVAGGRFAAKDAEKKFADDGMISNYAKEAVYALRDAGIINGVSDTEFAPTKYATRAETAVMLCRFMNSYGGGV